MRLIDAEELITAFPCGETVRTESVRATINYMPTIDPEPKKGKWIRHFDGNEWYWYCSNCKEQWYEEDLYMGGNEFPNFCPHCGADMRGEQND